MSVIGRPWTTPLDSTVAQLGSLDILVGNAGVYAEYGGPVGDISDEMWRKLWSVNVDGSLLLQGSRGHHDQG